MNAEFELTQIKFQDPNLVSNKNTPIEEISSGNILSKNETQLVATNRPSDPLLAQLQEQVNQLKTQINTLKNEVENPTHLKDKILSVENEIKSKEFILRKTALDIVQLLKNIESSQQTIEGKADEANKKTSKGICSIAIMTGIDIITGTSSVVSFIADAVFSKSTNKEKAKGWETTKFVTGGAFVLCATITIGIGIWYRIHKKRVQKLEEYKNDESQDTFKMSHGFSKKEIKKLKKLKPFAESLASATEFLVDQSIDTNTSIDRISNCIKEFKKISPSTKKALLPKLQQLIVATLDLLPNDHPLKQTLEKIKSVSQTKAEELNNSSSLILSLQDKKDKTSDDDDIPVIKVSKISRKKVQSDDEEDYSEEATFHSTVSRTARKNVQSDDEEDYSLTEETTPPYTVSQTPRKNLQLYDYDDYSTTDDDDIPLKKVSKISKKNLQAQDNDFSITPHTVSKIPRKNFQLKPRWSQNYIMKNKPKKFGSFEKSPMNFSTHDDDSSNTEKLSNKYYNKSIEDDDLSDKEKQKIKYFSELEKKLGCRISFLPIEGTNVKNPNYSIPKNEDNEDSDDDTRIEFDEKTPNLNNGDRLFDEDK